MFVSPVDIANRALQHIGATRITALDDDSRNASEINFCYDGLRLAELRRNVWRFAIRKVAIRPIGPDTRLFSPLYWDEQVTYPTGSVVLFEGSIWQTHAEVGAEPPGVGGPWKQYYGPMTVDPYDPETAYFTGELVSSAGEVFLSRISSNETAPGDPSWVNLGAAQEDLVILYPLDSGPRHQTGTRNVFRLPNNFLRLAPQDPKAGSDSFLGAPTGRPYDDWELEGNYLVTRQYPLIVLRFVANIADVVDMDAMFCEGLAARIGTEVCETITQSDGKLSTCASMYSRFMGEARTVNGIETGSEESPEDDYITCRR